MDFSLISKSVKTLGRSIDRNSPTILTALGVAGLVGTVIMAVKATPKALEAIEQEEAFRSEELSDNRPLDVPGVIEATWKLYLPTAIMGATTIACIVGANHISLRRNAALVSLLSLAETAAREYQTKVVETIGEKKEEKIRDEIANDHMSKRPIESSTVIITGKGEYTFFDSFSGRYFKSDVETIRRLVNDFNAELLRCAPMFKPINDFYYELGLESIELGDEMGWNAEDNTLQISTTSAKVVKGEPVVILEYKVWPKHY